MPPRQIPPGDNGREPFAQSINDQIRLANYGGPAPNAYLPTDPPSFSHVKGGKISEGNFPSYLDIPVQRAQDLGPGPGAYGVGTDLADAKLPAGGHWDPVPQPVFKLANAGEPEPGTYDPKMIPRTVPYAKFTSYAPKDQGGYIHDAQRHGREMPGPGQYDDVDAYETIHPFLPEGGRTLDAMPNKSYFDEVAKSRAHQVGPKYDVTKGFLVEPTGQPVYRYQSSTLKQTEHLVKQVCGQENPGPGTYDVQPVKPPPGAVPFHGLGRDNQYALPAPYDYNCPKDYTRRYYVPVLQSGTGNAIYGRFDHSRRPKDLAPLDQTAPDMTVKLERARSTEALRQARLAREDETKRYRSKLHPGLRHAANAYKDLSGKKLQGCERILPMSAKRVVDVGTGEDDAEFISFERHRAKLHVAAEDLDRSISALLEPLDTKDMLSKAQVVMEKKVDAKMRRDGIPDLKRELLMQELPSVLEDSFHEPAAAEGIVGSPTKSSMPPSPAKSSPGRTSPPKASPKKGLSPKAKASPKAKQQPKQASQVADTFELSAGSPSHAEPAPSPTFASPANLTEGTFVLGAAPSPGLGSLEQSSIALSAQASMARPADLTFGESDAKADMTLSQTLALEHREVSEEEHAIKESFVKTDQDKDGFISKRELKAALMETGHTPTDDEVETLFYLADTNEDGRIDFAEFKALILSGIDKRFHEFDVNQDGCLSEADLKHVVSTLVAQTGDFPEGFLDDLLAQMDRDADGRVNYIAFRRMMLEKQQDGSDDELKEAPPARPIGTPEEAVRRRASLVENKPFAKRYTTTLLGDALFGGTEE